MANKRTVEIFTAGCPLCEETVNLVNRIACPSCSVTVHSMQNPETRKRAKELRIHAIPAVVVNNRLATCCAAGGVDEAGLRAEGVGQPL